MHPETMADQSEQKFRLKVPKGDDREREVCTRCGFINYVNPKVVVGSVCQWEGRYLLCRRAIEPRKGYWTIPAGYLEEHETSEEGAKREAWEEACAQLDIDRLLAVYSIPRISQVQLIYRAQLLNPDVKPGVESLEVAFFGIDEIPWTDLAFPSVHWAIKQHESVLDRVDFPPFSNPEGETGNSMPRVTPG